MQKKKKNINKFCKIKKCASLLTSLRQSFNKLR